MAGLFRAWPDRCVWWPYETPFVLGATAIAGLGGRRSMMFLVIGVR